MTYYTEVETPVGRLLIAGDGAAIKRIYFQKGKNLLRPAPDWINDARPLAEPLRQLRSYFDGELKDFDLKLAPEGTPFQIDVWRALTEIPYGETISYGELARRIGKPSASRAVGAANGQNPIPIVIPCHRVIGASGKLTGYGGGLDIKEILLDLERRHAPRAVEQASFA